MCLLVFPLVEGHDLGWPLWIVALLVASVPVLCGFAAHQGRRKRTGATPLIEPSIFKRPAYVSGLAFSLVFVASLGRKVLQAGLVVEVVGLIGIYGVLRGVGAREP